MINKKSNKSLLIIIMILLIFIYKDKLNFDFLKNIPFLKDIPLFNNIFNKQNKPEIPSKLIINNKEKNDDIDLTASEDTISIINDAYDKLINNDSNIVYLDIKIDNNEINKIKIKLFNEIVPKTCKNFSELCKNKAYVNNIFHRLIKNFMIQGGDIVNKNGTGGISIYGNTFDDENFKLKHNKVGLLSMANSGPNTNNSQFFITLNSTQHLDDKHVVFGEVIDNLEFIKNLNNYPTNNDDTPQSNIQIVDCGIEE